MAVYNEKGELTGIEGVDYNPAVHLQLISMLEIRKGPRQKKEYLPPELTKLIFRYYKKMFNTLVIPTTLTNSPSDSCFTIFANNMICTYNNESKIATKMQNKVDGLSQDTCLVKLTKDLALVVHQKNAFAKIFYIYNVNTHTIIHLAQMRSDVIEKLLRLNDGQCLIFVPPSFCNSTYTMRMFNPVTLAWRDIEHKFKTERSKFAAVVLRTGHVMVIGGMSYKKRTPLTSCEIFCPYSLRCRTGKSLPMAVSMGSACLLPDGRVFFCGGDCGHGYNIGCYIYDQDNDEWEKKAPMTDPLVQHVCVAFPDGNVLVYGGSVDETRGYNYNTETDTWTTLSNWLPTKSRDPRFNNVNFSLYPWFL